MAESISSVVATYCQRFKVHAAYFDNLLPPRDLSMVITIPSFKEPNIQATLQSLSKCLPPSGSVEVIIGINAPENSPASVLEVNQHTARQIEEWKKNAPRHLHVLVIREESIPPRTAGAGFARKIVMDEAVQRWATLGIDGPIIGLDADCTVSTNYLIEITRTFSNPNVRVGHLNFEHLYTEEPDETLRKGITSYELHLHCYIQGLKLAQYPLAIYTVGSCMVVRASAYGKAGGMNRRKAGEDFHFLHKLAPLGGWCDIKEATVYPSCRGSDRVPFGTGKAQIEFQKTLSLRTYHADIYKIIRPFFQESIKCYNHNIQLQNFNNSLQNFLVQEKIQEHMELMRKQCTSDGSFRSRWWQWMDGLKVLRMVHYLRDYDFPNQPVEEVAKKLISQLGYKPEQKPEALLSQFRQLNRGE